MWNSTGYTFANDITVGEKPYGIFINTNNTIYVAASTLNQIQIWMEGDSDPITNITGNIINPYTVFVTEDDDIYFDNGINNGEVDRLVFNLAYIEYIVNPGGRCYGLFIDTNNDLYCSIQTLHQVVRKSLNYYPHTLYIVAGTYCPGMAADMLYQPQGIFVDTHFNLYVADSGNNRIQLFHYNNVNGNGITVAGIAAPTSFALNNPTNVILDADSYLFIVDSNNHRIIRQTSYGFQCIIGCFGSGNTPDKLNLPWSMAFDSYGNIYINDQGNKRIQEFILITNSCGKYNK
jgi:DNA-binding beta-propeller fold protein YncE